MTARPEDVGLATLPSHDDAAEAAVLGALVVSPECLALVAEILPDPEAIYSPARREVYRAALALRARGLPVEVLALRRELVAGGRLEAAGGAEALGALAEAAPPGVVVRPSEVAPYAREVAKLAGLRTAQVARLADAMEARHHEAP